MSSPFGKEPPKGRKGERKSISGKKKRERINRSRRREEVKQDIVERELDLAQVIVVKRNGDRVRGRLRLVPHGSKRGRYRDKIFIDANGIEEEIDTGDIVDIEELF